MCAIAQENFYQSQSQSYHEWAYQTDENCLIQYKSTSTKTF